MNASTHRPAALFWRGFLTSLLFTWGRSDNRTSALCESAYRLRIPMVELGEILAFVRRTNGAAWEILPLWLTGENVNGALALARSGIGEDYLRGVRIDISRARTRVVEFMGYRDAVGMSDAGVPVEYLLAVGGLSPRAVRKGWEAGLSVEYLSALDDGPVVR